MRGVRFVFFRPGRSSWEAGALSPAASAPPPGRTWKLAGYRRPNLAAMFTTFTTFTQAPGSDPLLMSSCQDHPGKCYLRLDFAHNQEAIQVSGNGRFATARHFPSSGGRGSARGICGLPSCRMRFPPLEKSRKSVRGSCLPCSRSESVSFSFLQEVGRRSFRSSSSSLSMHSTAHYLSSQILSP